MCNFVSCSTGGVAGRPKERWATWTRARARAMVTVSVAIWGPLFYNCPASSTEY